MKLIDGIMIVIGTALVAGCNSTPNCAKPQLYQEAQPGAAIESPAGLDPLQMKNEMRIPESSPTEARGDDAPCVEMPPTLGTG